MKIWDPICLVPESGADWHAVLYSRPESGVHVTEMIIYDQFIFSLGLRLATMSDIIIAAGSSLSVTYSGRTVYGPKNRRGKSAPDGSQFLAPVSGACVMLITTYSSVLNAYTVSLKIITLEVQ